MLQQGQFGEQGTQEAGLHQLHQQQAELCASVVNISDDFHAKGIFQLLEEF
ncbi:hypothetical protein O9993_01885 [Vibrio lentus]|nr:hypothetical protein [Vibrio lentus]